MQKNIEIKIKCYRQTIQECRAGMITVFVFLRKLSTSHSLLSINISQKNVSSKFFPKHSATESWKQAWKVESSSDVRGVLPWRFQIWLYTRNSSALSGYCTYRGGLVTLSAPHGGQEAKPLWQE